MTLSLSLPAFDAVAGSCEAGLDSCRDLAGLELWGERGGAPQRLASEALAASQAGSRLTLDLRAFAGWRVWVCTLDARGNRSCPSDSVEVPASLAVDAPAPAAGRIRVYDVMGRLVAEDPGWRRRAAPGLYWVLEGGRLRRLALVR